MAEKSLDCRGLACPHPVVQTKEIIDRGGVEQLTVLVDNAAAQENVSRFLQRSGFEVQMEERAGTLAVIGRRGAGAAGEAGMACEIMPGQKILVLIGTDRLGTGDDTLGRKLLVNFVGTLKEMGRELWCLVLLNAGVKLAVAGSEVLENIRALAGEGVMVLVCGTCLDHFHLLEAKLVGETTNMLDIVSHMQLADKVIPLT
ncbi:MAG: sulfurtransferase-like selenium metabolism protein YedF [Syntrophales bacterium]|nr:sulfurtransferase-like selenium metabolism protein YedF [Syntrophales bacterium]MDD5642430.1 sulfurtransferase-like selenium metabolism protein YedF [Syntrophales bacterium]